MSDIELAMSVYRRAAGEPGSEKGIEAVWYEARRCALEDAPRASDEIRWAVRRLCARLVASAHLLDVPFTDAPDQSPWTRVKRDMAALYAAAGIRFAHGLPAGTYDPAPSPGDEINLPAGYLNRVLAYRYTAPDGRVMVLDPSEVAIVLAPGDEAP